MRQYVSDVADQTCICSSLSVVENSSGKKRLVVNMWHVNQCLQKQKFKYRTCALP